MKQNQSLWWRKGLFLSATFLLSIILATSCKKKETSLGQNTIDQNNILSSAGIDTFQLRTFTIAVDSVISDNPAFALLGSYNDPVFGTVNAEFYTQFRLEGLNPDFGDLNTIAIDSFVLGLEYSGFYGESGDQTFEVYEITDPNGLHLDSTYYSFSTLAVGANNLMAAGKEVVYMDENDITVIGADTVDPQLRLHLDTNKARTFLEDAMINNPTAFTSNEEFADYFKGFLVRTNNGPQASGDGGVFYFNLNDALSKATIYYTQAGVQQSFDFLINSNSADFNHIDIDNFGTKVETVINDTISGMTEFYSQSFASRAVIQIPGLSNIPKNAIVHSAVLELPIQYQTAAKYAPAFDASIATRESSVSDNLLGINVLAGYVSSFKRYEVDLRAYVQAIITGEIDNTEIIVSPLLFITSMDRIIFNGPNTDNKAKPKIRVLYTEF